MNLSKQKIFMPAPGSGAGSGSGSDSSGTSGSPDYTRSEGIAVNIGGLLAGFVPTGTVGDLLDKMLYPYQAPGFGSFYFSLPTSVLEIGASVAEGSKTFLWSVSNAANMEDSSIIIRNVTDNILLASGLANDGSQSIVVPALVKTGIANHSFSIEGMNTEGGVFSRLFTLNWLPRRFAGTLAAGSLAALQGVTSLAGLNAVAGIATTLSDLNYAKPGMATYNCSGSDAGRYIWFLWDAGLGGGTFSSGAAPAAFRPVQVIQFTNAFGITRPYNLYVSSNPFNGASVPITAA